MEQEQEQRKAEQASRITYWEEETAYLEEEGDLRKTKIHVLNRSLDPVPRWSLEYWGPGFGFTDSMEQRIAFGALPPCTELVINSPVVFYELEWRLGGAGQSMASFQKLTFTDTHGNTWTRNVDGALFGESEFGANSFRDLNKTLKDSKSTMRPAEECGSGG
ncbi:hypothetical protein [Streptomyces sp. NPDC029674]|uniref:hypothetical protein n=1 Tax=Streptomyces sp. NPDC029674 TaxID=3365297 RepID=UPI00385004A8